MQPVCGHRNFRPPKIFDPPGLLTTYQRIGEYAEIVYLYDGTIKVSNLDDLYITTAQNISQLEWQASPSYLRRK